MNQLFLQVSFWENTCKPTLVRNHFLVKSMGQHFHRLTIWKKPHANTGGKTFSCTLCWSAFQPNLIFKPLVRLKQFSLILSIDVKAYKMEYMCFNQTGDISTLNGISLKLVDKLTYQGSSVSYVPYIAEY